ncbi:DnaJ/Hsp40 cysteine-rich domain superfamily protein [Hibiscus syriacus]|uniref:DnaJ/Hsp40 cysteine-rich domain superfamily protein n=1 Tax=Hibiscus syriacus TaxID=106335 RepID=A0A6A3D0G9_HIBSY|nr:VQ motif-containing protein 33-like [Hibiscus syriacus]KAE8735203.1 DnaJ/Hsp40 cysteine-rich domain superfamily protein [Hibiscus syriacus]
MEKHLKSITSSSVPSTPKPTTFVEADANTFKDLVQKLTGSTNDTDKLPVNIPGRLSSKTSSHGGDHPTAPRRPPFKLQERRKLQHSMKKLEIKLGLTTLRNSPSHCVFDCQTRRLDSPVTPLGSESLFYSSSGTVSPSSPVVSEEEKAIAEKGFYLHPSTLNTPRGSRSPELLTLFPLSSPREEKRD